MQRLSFKDPEQPKKDIMVTMIPSAIMQIAASPFLFIKIQNE
jgi:hypothetical protein